MTPKPQPAFVQRVLEQLNPLGEPIAKAMFGGYSLYLDGRCMAIIVDGALYVKGDAETADEYAHRTMPPFTYDMKGKVGTMSYYRVAPKDLKDPEAFDLLVGLARGAAKRAAAKKKR